MSKRMVFSLIVFVATALRCAPADEAQAPEPARVAAAVRAMQFWARR